MKLLIAGLMLALTALSQSPSEPQPADDAKAPADAQCENDDSFCGLRKTANKALNEWRLLETSVFDKQIPALKDTCSPKIPNMIDKVQASMEKYIALEREYTRVWAEQSREQLKVIKNNIAAKDSLTDNLRKLMDSEEQDYTETKRRHDELEKLGNAADLVQESEGLLKQMEETKSKIQLSMDKLKEAEQEASNANNLALLRDAEIKQRERDLDAENQGLESVYLTRRNSYQARCIAKGTLAAPPVLPKIDFGPAGAADKKAPPK